MADSEPLGSVVATAADSPAYSDDGVVVHWLCYHVVLATRRQKRFFDDEALAARADALVREAAEGAGCRVRACAVHPSWVTLEVEAPAGVAPTQLATVIARGAGGTLKRESGVVRGAGAAFVHRYLVSTEAVPEGDCAAFVGRVPRR